MNIQVFGQNTIHALKNCMSLDILLVFNHKTLNFNNNLIELSNFQLMKNFLHLKEISRFLINVLLYNN